PWRKPERSHSPRRRLLHRPLPIRPHQPGVARAMAAAMSATIRLAGATSARDKRSTSSRQLGQQHRLQTQSTIVDREISGQIVAHDGVGMNKRNLLRHDTDMDGIAPQVLEAVDPESITATRQQGYVALQADV